MIDGDASDDKEQFCSSSCCTQTSRSKDPPDRGANPTSIKDGKDSRVF